MRNLTTCLLSLSLGACVMSTKPSDDVGFARATDLHMFEGCYVNVGEAGKDGISSSLSAAIWPEADLDPKTIESVEVSTDGDDTLVVTAIRSGTVIKTSRFVNGKDFELSNGRIKVRSKVLASPGTESGNPFIGVATASMFLGVDKSGNGRLLTRGNMLGTVFIVFPAVGHMSEAVRFSRTRCHGS